MIEHQTRIDYSMPYRIMEYQYKIIESAIDIKKIKNKKYKIPLVIPIVLYTGRKRWDAKKYVKETQENFYQYNGKEIGEYNVIDVNDYTEEELLKENTFLSKAMLIESKIGTANLIHYLDKIIDIINKDEIYSKEQKKLLSAMLDLSLRRKIDNNNETDRLIKKIKKEGGGNMLAILDMIDEENRRILNKGIRKGIKERNKEILEVMIKNNYTMEQIMQITGFSKEKIEKMKK